MRWPAPENSCTTHSSESSRAYDAVSLEEVVNKDRLKKLHIMGHLIPNVSQYEYIAISLPKEIKTDSPLEERN